MQGLAYVTQALVLFRELMSYKLAPDLSVYAGYWVAIVRKRVVATADSAHAALLHLRVARLKDEPILRFVPKERTEITK